MLEDTIVAISTAPGESGIGIVRLSGSRSIEIASRIFRGSGRSTLEEMPGFSACYGWVVDPREGQVIDEAIALVMRAPRSYTREDVVELNCHGGTVVLREVLRLAVSQGARLAEPGEFTKRAFLNGRIDLSQAEAVADLIKAKTDRSLRMAVSQLRGGLSRQVRGWRSSLLDILSDIEASIDFPAEVPEVSPDDLCEAVSGLISGIKELIRTARSGRLLRDGARTVFIGKPNVGKSSLLNALLEESRAIVTDVPGTTRDSIEEYLNIDGLPLRVIDTAGLRDTEDPVEREGVHRTRRCLEEADLLLPVIDASSPLGDDDLHVLESSMSKPAVVVLNKMDLGIAVSEEELRPYRQENWRSVYASAKSGEGIDELKAAIRELMLGEDLGGQDLAVAANARHQGLLETAAGHLESALSALRAGTVVDLVSIDLRQAYDALGEVIGESTGDDIVDAIFRRFCIGK